MIHAVVFLGNFVCVCMSVVAAAVLLLVVGVYGANHKACPHEGRKGLGRMLTKQRSAMWFYQQTSKTGRMYQQTVF